jgi:hypothetical protein
MPKQNIFVTWAEFTAHGIPRYSRRYTNQMVDTGTFPPPVRLSVNRIAWVLADLETWKATRPAFGEPLPVLWPVRTAERWRGSAVASHNKSVGRPRGSRVINGKLVRAEELEAAGAA